MAKSKVGSSKSIVFASVEIPKDDPNSVELKTNFKKGEKICFRAFFEKTFADYVKDEKALGYVVRFYVDGEKQNFFAGMRWKIDADQYSWNGFQDEVVGESKNNFDLLKRGKHDIDVKIYMQAKNPTKQIQVNWTNTGVSAMDVTGLIDGSLVASGSFTFENTDAAPNLGIDLSKVNSKLKDAIELLQSKDLMQRLGAADEIKSFVTTKDFVIVYPVLRDTVLKEKPGAVMDSLMRALDAANSAGVDVSDLIPFLVTKLPNTSRFLGNIVGKNPGKKAVVRSELEKANIKPTSMELAELLNKVSK